MQNRISFVEQKSGFRLTSLVIGNDGGGTKNVRNLGIRLFQKRGAVLDMVCLENLRSDQGSRKTEAEGPSGDCVYNSFQIHRLRS